MTDAKSSGTTRKIVDRFFDKELMPLARELKNRGAIFLDTAHAPGASSYYVQRPLRAMSPEAFEWGGADSPEQLQVALLQLWQEPSSQPLAELAPSLSRLARLLYQIEDQPGEVSSFVYVMY